MCACLQFHESETRVPLGSVGTPESDADEYGQLKRNSIMSNQNQQLTDALNILDEDRITQEQRDFDAAYVAALQEDREMTAQAAKRIKEKRQAEFLNQIAACLLPNIKLDGGEAIFNDFHVALHHVISFWAFPAAVEVTKADGKYQKYRPGKNGWNYHKIAEEMGCRIQQLVRRGQSEAVCKGNSPTAAKLCAKLKLCDYSSLVRPSMDKDKPVIVGVKFARSMTVEQAERVINLLKAEGLINEWEFNNK